MNTKIKNIWPGWEIDSDSADKGILGSGSFGDVYRIRRSTHGITEYAALKVITIPRDSRELNQLRQELETQEQLSSYYLDVKESFESEYATMALVRGHANIVYCDDIRFEEHENKLGWTIYIKMELLTPMIKKVPLPNPEAMAQKLGKDICRALILCHENGIIHRDIKPHNIFLSRDGNFKLGDFGIAKHMDGTQLGTLAGTQEYMAPEIARMQPYSFQADVYSLGLVMYWMLNTYTGPFLPLDGSKPVFSVKMEARNKRLTGIPLPDPINGSDDLKKIVLKACAFEPKDRYASAREMLRDLMALESSPETRMAAIDDGETPQKPLTADDTDDETVLVSTAGNPPGTGRGSGAAHISGVGSVASITKGSTGVGSRATAQTTGTGTKGTVQSSIPGNRKPSGGKKSKKKLLWLLLPVIAVVAVCVFFLLPSVLMKETVTQIPGDDAWSLLEVGYIEDPDSTLRIDDYVTDKFPKENGLISFYTYTGEQPEGFEFKKISYLGSGLYAARTQTEDINSLSLITREGEVLFSQDACYIDWAGGQDEYNPRYLLVYTATAQTVNEENYLVSVDENGYVYTGYLDGNTMYTGLVRAYDTFEKRFVPNLPLVQDDSSLSVCGNSIMVTQGDTHVLYSSEGLPLMETTASVRVYNGFFILDKSGTYQVYSQDGESTFVTNHFLMAVSSYYPYLRMTSSTDNSDTFLDINGNVILEGKYLSDCYDGLLITRPDKKTTKNYGLVTPEGREILPGS